MTKDVVRRISDHNTGRVRSTRVRRPFELIYTESFESRPGARERERYFKTAAGRRALNKVLAKKHWTLAKAAPSLVCRRSSVGYPPDRTICGMVIRSFGRGAPDCGSGVTGSPGGTPSAESSRRYLYRFLRMSRRSSVGYPPDRTICGMEIRSFGRGAPECGSGGHWFSRRDAFGGVQSSVQSPKPVPLYIHLRRH
jgi:putative endonuclease